MSEATKVPSLFVCPDCGHTTTYFVMGDVISCGKCGLWSNPDGTPRPYPTVEPASDAFVHWQPIDGLNGPRCLSTTDPKGKTDIFLMTRDRPSLTCPECIALVDPQRVCEHRRRTGDGETWKCNLCGAMGAVE